MPPAGIDPGAGIVGALINVAIGAVVLLLIIRLVRGGDWSNGSGIGWSRRRSGRW
jgi:hypothetical protein